MEHGARSTNSPDESFLFKMAKDSTDQGNRKRKIFRDVTQGIEGLRLRAAMGERNLSKQLQKRVPFVSDFSAGQSLRQKWEGRRGAFRSHGRKAGTPSIVRVIVPALFLTVCELFCFASERLWIKNIFRQLPLSPKAERNTMKHSKPLALVLRFAIVAVRPHFVSTHSPPRATSTCPTLAAERSTNSHPPEFKASSPPGSILPPAWPLTAKATSSWWKAAMGRSSNSLQRALEVLRLRGSRLSRDRL